MGVKLKYFLQPGYVAPTPAKDIMTALQTQDIAEAERQAAAERSKRNLEAQNQLLAQLQDQAAGKGPSLAEAQLRSASERSLSGQLAAAAAARGGSQAALQRGLINQAGDARRQLAQDAATAKIQEQQNARNSLQSLVTGEQQNSDALARGYLGDVVSIGQSEQERRLKQQAQDLAAAKEKNANRSNMFGAISGAVGGISKLFSDKNTKMAAGSYSDKKTKETSKSSKFLNAMEELNKASKKMSQGSGSEAAGSDFEKGSEMGASGVDTIGTLANLFKQKLQKPNPLDVEFNALNSKGVNPLDEEFNDLNAQGQSPQYIANMNAVNSLSKFSDEKTKKASREPASVYAKKQKFEEDYAQPVSETIKEDFDTENLKKELKGLLPKWSDEKTKKPIRQVASVNAQKYKDSGLEKEFKLSGKTGWENIKDQLNFLKDENEDEVERSDKRAKKSREASDVESPRNLADSNKKIQKFLDAVKPVAYEYKEEYQQRPNDHGEQLGIIAQDLEKAGEAGKRMVQEDENGTKMVDFGKGFGTMLAAQAQLNERLKEIESKFKKKA